MIEQIIVFSHPVESRIYLDSEQQKRMIHRSHDRAILMRVGKCQIKSNNVFNLISNFFTHAIVKDFRSVLTEKKFKYK